MKEGQAPAWIKRRLGGKVSRVAVWPFENRATPGWPDLLVQVVVVYGPHHVESQGTWLESKVLVPAGRKTELLRVKNSRPAQRSRAREMDELKMPHFLLLGWGTWYIIESQHIDLLQEGVTVEWLTEHDQGVRVLCPRYPKI